MPRYSADVTAAPATVVTDRLAAGADSAPWPGKPSAFTPPPLISILILPSRSRTRISGLDPTDKAARVARYALRVREEVEIIAHSCGLPDVTGFQPRYVTAIERGVGGFRAASGSD